MKWTILSEIARIFDLLGSCSFLCEATPEIIAVVSWTNQCPKLFIPNSRSIYLILSHWNKLPFRDPYKQVYKRLYSGIIWILWRFRKGLWCVHIFASFRSLLCAKLRVIPLKTISLPCLELWSLMLSELASN